MMIYISAQLLRLLYNLGPIRYWSTAPLIQFLSPVEIVIELTAIVVAILAVVLARNKDRIEAMLDKLREGGAR